MIEVREQIPLPTESEPEEEAAAKPIGKEEIGRAYETLLRYKAAKANL